MSNVFFLGFEVACILLFVYTLVRELSIRSVWELLIGILYGVLLEFFTIKGFAAYSYGTQFALMIGGVPIAIGLMWSTLIYWSRRLAEKLHSRWFVTAIIAAYIAIAFDLVLDPIAVRLGWWTWGLALDQHWFGVMVGNFFGWLFVVSYYSGCLSLLPEEYPVTFWYPSRAVIAALASILILVPSLLLTKTLLAPYSPIYSVLVLSAILVTTTIYCIYDKTHQK